MDDIDPCRPVGKVDRFNKAIPMYWNFCQAFSQDREDPAGTVIHVPDLKNELAVRRVRVHRQGFAAPGFRNAVRLADVDVSRLPL